MTEELYEIEGQILSLLNLPMFKGLEVFQISVNKNNLFLFLDGETENLESAIDTLEAIVGTLAQKMGLKLVSFEHTIGLDKKITNTNCLATIRRNSPVKLNQLIKIYQEKEFPDINEDTVSNVTDRLRKAGLIVRSKNGSFFVTSKGFDRLGSKLGADSPDVIRLLALAAGKV